MNDKNQTGGAALVLINILLILGLVGAGGFGWWAFQQRQDYKNNFDQKLKVEVGKAKAAQKDELEKGFAEREKSPNKNFKGSATYGSISFDYPKNWSGYVDQTNSNQPINGYFFPDIVPSVSSNSNSPIAFALRVELVSEDYAQAVKQLDSQITQGALKATAYVPPKMAGAANVQTGTRFDGEIEQNISGSLVVIKVRDKTLKIYTQSPSYLSDFDNIVLKTLTFAP
ncbi:MAG TPA: hypothetical protein VI336_03985 [Candidatus Saccharimonadales bacterium]|nr:hypothetical protein [Candidatus Saccharimonadales bacterium]